MPRWAAEILLQDMQIVLERVLDYTKEIDFEESYCEIPWHCIAGMYNRIVHDYFDIDNRITAF